MPESNSPRASIDDVPSVDVSVVFATRDRADQLAETLAAYETLDTRGLRWELIVIDNNSGDDTPAILDAYARRLPLVRLFETEGGQNRARNIALDRLHGKLVVFTDDDVIPHPDCLQAYVAAARRWPNDAIFGARIEPRFPKATPDWLRRNDFFFASTAFARYRPADDEGYVKRHPYGPSFAVRHDALIDHRFPEHLGPQSGAYAMGGEGYFLREIAGTEYRYVYVPGARVEHIVRPEQIEESWLRRRARNKGRGQIYLPSDKKPRRIVIGGVSLRLWLATARAGLRYMLACYGGRDDRRITRAIQYELRRGQIEELRHSRARCPNPS